MVLRAPDIYSFANLTESDTEYPIEVRPNFAKDEYKQAVDRMIRYIIEGDIYIANMTQQLTIESEKQPPSLTKYSIFSILRGFITPFISSVPSISQAKRQPEKIPIAKQTFLKT